jgi:hypothetical protein
MVKATPRKSSPGGAAKKADPDAERAALKAKKLAVGMNVVAKTPNTHISRRGTILAISDGDEDGVPMVTIKGKTAGGKNKTWRNRPSLLEAQ